MNAPAIANERRDQRRQSNTNDEAATGGGLELRTRSRSSRLRKRTMKSSGACRRTDIASSSMLNWSRRCSRTIAGVTGGLVPPTKATRASDKASSAA